MLAVDLQVPVGLWAVCACCFASAALAGSTSYIYPEQYVMLGLHCLQSARHGMLQLQASSTVWQNVMHTASTVVLACCSIFVLCRTGVAAVKAATASESSCLVTSPPGLGGGQPDACGSLAVEQPQANLPALPAPACCCVSPVSQALLCLSAACKRLVLLLPELPAH